MSRSRKLRHIGSHFRNNGPSADPVNSRQAGPNLYRPRKRAHLFFDAFLEFRYARRQFIPQRQPLLEEEAVMFVHRSRSGLLQDRDLAPQPLAG